MVQSVHQSILVDQVAPGGIDEPCTGLHLGKGVGIEQIFCFCGGWGQTHHMVAGAEQALPRHQGNTWVCGLNMWVVRQHLHAKGLGQGRHLAPNVAVAHHPQRGTAQFAPHPGLCLVPRLVLQACRADVAHSVDQHAHHPFGHRCTKTSAGARHQNAVLRSRIHIDGADVHGATAHRPQLGQSSEDRRVKWGLAVSDDDVAALGGSDQISPLPILLAGVEPHLGQFAQLAQRTLAKVSGQTRGRVGDQNRGHQWPTSSAPAATKRWLAHR